MQKIRFQAHKEVLSPPSSFIQTLQDFISTTTSTLTTHRVVQCVHSSLWHPWCGHTRPPAPREATLGVWGVAPVVRYHHINHIFNHHKHKHHTTARAALDYRYGSRV